MPRYYRKVWLISATTSVFIVLLLSGCGEPTQSGQSPTRPSSATASPEATPQPPAHEHPDFQVQTLATDLQAPWSLAFAPDGRIFLTERPGHVRVIQDGHLLPEPAATIAEVAQAGEGGLLGLTLDPNFATNHYVYVYYTYEDDSGLKNRVVRYTEQDNNLSRPRVLLDHIPGAGIHNGGRIAFGPDGKLYITAGDAADSDLAQSPQSLAGKIHRINPDGSIPKDNPFPGSPIYSYGHRNPQGLAWEPKTGQLYATEHGSSAHDEINRIRAGANYGWPIVHGAITRSEFMAPLVESGSTTWAPSGATFVTSEHFPAWQGNLLFAGLRSHTLWRLTLPQDDEGAPKVEPLLQGYGRLRFISEGPDGLLYILTNNRDGRGNPDPGDDRLLRIAPKQ